MITVARKTKYNDNYRLVSKYNTNSFITYINIQLCLDIINPLT